MTGFVMCTALVLAGADGSTHDTALADQVAKLVRQLDARELGQRDEAERKLLEMGVAVLPLLPTVGERTPAEVAQRVTRIQQSLLLAQANSAAEPTTVTLPKGEMPLAEAFEAIAKQTGNPIVDHRQAFGEDQADVKVEVDFDKVQFWQALDQVLDRADLTLYSFAGQRGAYVVNRPSTALPRAEQAVYAGVFRLEPVRFEAMRDLRAQREQALRFFLEITWEPRLQPIAIYQPLGEVRAAGDDGTPIAVGNTEARPETFIRDGMSAAELEIPLTLPDRSIKTVSSLKGRLQAMIPGPPHDFRFVELPVTPRGGAARRVEQRQAGTTVTVDHLRKNNQVWEVGLRVKFDSPASALESHRGWILDNQAFFEGPDGRRFEAGGFEQTRQSRDEVGINYFFDLEGDPQKLAFVYRTPITILELNVDYEFKNLSLP